MWDLRPKDRQEAAIRVARLLCVRNGVIPTQNRTRFIIEYLRARSESEFESELRSSGGASSDGSRFGEG